jgi:hypothetical protein
VLTNLGSFERGSSEWLTEAFLKTTKGDPEALLLILQTFVDTPRAAIAASTCRYWSSAATRITTMARPRSGRAAAARRIREVPGNHMSAVTHRRAGARRSRTSSQLDGWRGARSRAPSRNPQGIFS